LKQHSPSATRLGDCALDMFAIEVRGSGVSISWRAMLQCRQAATTLRCSVPPSRRATMCSAVHWKWPQSSRRRPYRSAKGSGILRPHRHAAVVAAVLLAAGRDFAESTELVVVGHGEKF
jgi:hypothetical protein